jgi:hypothetical protein
MKKTGVQKSRETVPLMFIPKFRLKTWFLNELVKMNKMNKMNKIQCQLYEIN